MSLARAVMSRNDSDAVEIAPGHDSNAGTSQLPSPSAADVTLPSSWEERLATDESWFRAGAAEDGFTGRRLRENLCKYVTIRENETPKGVAGRYGVAASALLDLNNARFFGGKLKASSRLKKKTKLLVPAAAEGSDDMSIEGVVVATNYTLWLIRHDDGDVMELVASEVREACWNFRVVHEGWNTSVNDAHIGVQLRRAYPVGGQPYAVNGEIVGYLPPGEDADDFALWHAMHDDGDEEDLEELEVLEGIRCHQEWQRSGARAKPENTPSGADSLGKFGVKRPREEASELQHSQGSRAHKKKDVKAPKRPRTGFVLFCNDMRGKLSTDNPGISFGDSGRRCGELWRALDDVEKSKYNAMADDDKQRYIEEMKTYVPPLIGEDGAHSAGHGAVHEDSHDNENSEEAEDSSTEVSSSDECEMDEQNTGIAGDSGGGSDAADNEEDETAPYDLVWEDLTPAQRGAANVLGYTADQWTAEEVPPACIGSQWEVGADVVRCWEELSSEHQVAATLIGYERWTWDQAMRDCELPADNADGSMFALAEKCFAFDSEGKAYKAKIVDRRKKSQIQATCSPQWEYLVHYQGWKSKWDAWMTNESIFKQNEENLKLCSESQTGTIGQGPGQFKKSKAAEKARVAAEKAERKAARAAAKATRDKEKASKRAKLASKKRTKLKKVGKSGKSAHKTEYDAATQRVRRSSSEIQMLKQAKRTVLPPILELQLGRDYGFVHKDRRLLQLPREPSVLQVLDDFLAAKLKSLQSKLSKDRNRAVDKEPKVLKTALVEFSDAALGGRGGSQPAGSAVVPSTAFKGRPDVLSDGASVHTIPVEVRRRAFRIGSVLTALVDVEVREGIERSSATVGTIRTAGTVVILELKDGLDQERPRFRCNMGWLNLFQDSGTMAFEDTGRKVEESMSRQFQVSAYWSAPEDQKLMEIVKSEGASDWARKAALLGTGRSCEAVYKHYTAIVANGGLQCEMLQKVAAPSYTTVTTRGPTEVSREASYKRQQDEELQPWQELIRGLREYFNESLKPFLLYAPEREQVEQLELKHPDKEFATLFGAEHLLRLLVQMPNFFEHMDTSRQRELENRLYGHHSFAKWLERHAYDYFHADTVAPMLETKGTQMEVSAQDLTS